MAAPAPIRVLCLHGHGSNSRAFEAETAALRHELGDKYEWVFAEGSVTVPDGDDATALYLEKDHYFSFYDRTDASSLGQFHKQLEEFISKEGEFPLVACQSLTAGIVAALLMRKAEEKPEEPPLFKGAVFLAGFNPLNPKAIRENRFELLENAGQEVQLSIPTANIWGSKDVRHVDRSPKLAAICDPSMNVNFIHDAETMIPGAGDEGALVGAAQAFQKTADRALCAV